MDVIDFTQVIRFFAALLFVLGLMGGLSYVMRRYYHKHPMIAGNKRRLKVVEILQLDSRRKAVLLKQDDKEHLLILGANSETVIESSIESKQNHSLDELKMTASNDRSNEEQDDTPKKKKKGS